MQPTSRVVGSANATPTRDVASSSATNVTTEPPDVFCGLASLIVEGRVPKNDGRGYGEGPHVPSTGSKALSLRHECSDENNTCKKDENFRKHMLLLWQNNVPVSIEVLLCSTCRVSQQKVRSVEFSTIPEPGSILLEQWTVAIQNHRHGDHLISSHGLYQAVRSYLHYSQLSAWYNSSRGQEPKNVLYRITIPGEAFSSKFSCDQPEEHLFPSANVGRTSSVRVSVRSLPRCEDIPRVTCPHNTAAVMLSPVMAGLSLSPIPASSSSTSSGSESTSPSLANVSPIPEEPDDHHKLSMAASIDWKEQHEETDLRKTLVKSRLGQAGSECQEKLPRSDSMDSMLGDSLLDPPQCLQKIPPKRYQSPSRCGSPSLETPEHLLFGKNNDSTSSSSDTSSRLARQDLLRRRDISLYTGLHPRLLHGQQPQVSTPRLSLFSKQVGHQPRTPCRAFPAGTTSTPQMPSPSSFQHPPFRFEASSPTTSSEMPSWMSNDQDLEEKSGARQKRCVKMAPEEGEEEDEVEAEDGMLPVDFWTTYSDSDSSSRRCSMKDEAADDFSWASTLKTSKPKCKNKTLDDILGIQPESGIFSDHDSSVTRVYRAEIPPLPPAQHPPISASEAAAAKETTTTAATAATDPTGELSKSDILLGAILRTCERNRHLEDQQQQPHAKTLASPSRLRSLSENSQQHYHPYLLEPLDLSFDTMTSKDWSEDEEEEEAAQPPSAEVQSSSRRSSFSDAHVPTPDECAYFRQSFDSATSMVFHRKTGLPLTSSPAPLRRGTDKFDFDDSITSPYDIKKALFAKKQKTMKMVESNNKENISVQVVPVLEPVTTPEKGRERRPSKKLLSASAPATLTSNNLLGNFEESVLNGRLEPNSTVEGFTAEIGAAGSFQPKHKTLPVTVFFYTLCDNAAYSSPYLGHINLGKKGYRVPPKGTIQVTLFNPLGTVVKMFVVMYDLSDMPPNSQTFLRQRTLYVPSSVEAGVNSEERADLQKWLRYLIHLRFASSNTGKIYLHTDIRMIIFRKSDLDTAADYTSSKGFELRSFTQGPNNPKFSPRR